MDLFDGLAAKVSGQLPLLRPRPVSRFTGESAVAEAETEQPASLLRTQGQVQRQVDAVEPLESVVAQRQRVVPVLEPTELPMEQAHVPGAEAVQRAPPLAPAPALLNVAAATALPPVPEPSRSLPGVEAVESPRGVATRVHVPESAIEQPPRLRAAERPPLVEQHIAQRLTTRAERGAADRSPAETWDAQPLPVLVARGPLPLQTLAPPPARNAVAVNTPVSNEPAQTGPVIEVTIGRVEVRAVTAPPSQRREPQRPHGLTLDEYLQRRQGGA